MKLLNFNMQLRAGCLLTMPFDKLIEEFRREFGKLGTNEANEVYRAFSFSTKENEDDKENFTSIMKYLCKLYLGVDGDDILDRDKYISSLVNAQLKPRSEAFMRNMYALYVFACNNIELNSYDLFQYMFKYTEIIRLSDEEWDYDVRIDTIRYGEDERVPLYILPQVIQTLDTLLTKFCREVYMTPTYSLILPNVVISGSTFIYYPSTGVLEIGNKILVPADENKCSLLNSQTLKELSQLQELCNNLNKDRKEKNYET